MNNSTRSSLVDKLYRGVDPFASFDASQFTSDFQGWNSAHHFLRQSIQAVQPSVVIEIGVWKGGSVLSLADEIKQNSLDAVVIAVDTWRGSCEHWLEDQWFGFLAIQGGISRLQETFMTNVITSNLQDYIVPLPLDSINAFEVCKKLNICPDIIHIDAGHDYQSVKTDLQLWWSLLRDGGIMIMDDYLKTEQGQAIGWVDVVKAVDDFLVDHKDEWTGFNHGGNKCMFYKGINQNA
jgi:predicted O-methyltransferase YrrM